MTDAAQPVLLPSGNDKIWGILSHLSGFLGFGLLLPLVVYLAMREESAYVADNAKEALNFHLSLLIYGIVAIPLCFVVVGFVILGALWILALVCGILAAIKASEGACYRYPLTLRMVK